MMVKYYHKAYVGFSSPCNCTVDIFQNIISGEELVPLNATIVVYLKVDIELSLFLFYFQSYGPATFPRLYQSEATTCQLYVITEIASTIFLFTTSFLSSDLVATISSGISYTLHAAITIMYIFLRFTINFEVALDMTEVFCLSCTQYFMPWVGARGGDKCLELSMCIAYHCSHLFKGDPDKGEPPPPPSQMNLCQ